MKTSTFNRIFENARSVNIQSNEWFNYAGFFWMQCTEKQLAKMRMLLKAQGCKTTVKNGEEWYILNSGTLSPGEYDQMLARQHRPGQTRGVTFYHFVAPGTVDVTVRKAREQRRDVVDSILNALVDPGHDEADDVF